MKKLILTFIVALSIVVLVNGQDYKTGVGLRGGFSNGLTIKHFVTEKAAFEGMIALNAGNSNGFGLTGLYEIHNQAFEVEQLKWYYGFGAHIGSFADSHVTNTVIGIDGILGIEYSFTEAPINIGLDWKPLINLVGNSQFYPDGGALSIRYIF
jgi:hypothetical protein